MNAYQKLTKTLPEKPKVYLITGVAGFIDSNLLETLLKLNQTVVGLDNFVTVHQHNLNEVKGLISAKQWGGFNFLEGDIRQLEDCQRACAGAEYVVHQAALGSVSRSINDLIATNSTNIDGFLNMVVATSDIKIKDFAYSTSSSIYWDSPSLPKVETNIVKPLSLYVIAKYVNEPYDDFIAKTYNFKCSGLPYFNVFGKRQDTNSAHAAIISKWTAVMIQGEIILINGDSEISRNFFFIENAVQANLLAVITNNPETTNQVYDVVAGDHITLNQLFEEIHIGLKVNGVDCEQVAIYRDFRAGEELFLHADVSEAKTFLRDEARFQIEKSITAAMLWYVFFLTSVAHP